MSRSRGELRERFMELADGRWVRASGKRPLTVSGSPASSVDPSTWGGRYEVISSRAGDGFGVMLGGGLGCYDFDNCFIGGRLDPLTRGVIDSIPEKILLVERSVSGRGLHVFVEARESRGSRSAGVERYTRGRFIRMTFDEVSL